MPTSYHQLFVYGSLRRDSGHPAHELVSNDFVLLGPARVQAKVYDLGEYPGAVPSTDDSFISGELYRLKEGVDFEAAATRLDEYEGVNETPPLFTRSRVNVYTDGLATDAWIYWYNGAVAGKPWIASGDALQGMERKISYKRNNN